MGDFDLEKGKRATQVTVTEIPSEGTTPQTEKEGFHFSVATNKSEETLEVKTTAPAEETFPEGGLDAWKVVLGSWCGLFASMGVMSSLSPINAYVAAHQLAAYPTGTIGWIWSVYMFLAMFGGLYIGPAFDMHGPKVLLPSGTALMATGLALFSFATQYWHFMLSFGLLLGIGASLMLSPCMTAVTHWFKARRGLAMGITMTAGGTGGIVFPLMLQALIPRLGFAWAVRALGLVILLCGATACALVRRRLAPPTDARVHPDLTIFREPAFALAVAAVFLMELAMYLPITYLGAYALASGYPEALAYALPPVLNAASVLGRASPGLFVDRLGPFNSAIAAAATAIAAVLAVWLPFGASSLAGLIVFALLYGLATGCGVSLTPVCIGRLCETRHYGRYYATCYVVVSLGYLVGTPVAGNIVSSQGGEYGGLMVFTATVYAGSLALLVAVRVVKAGWKIRVVC